MYSIMVVDDERHMREGIVKLLPWSEMGINRVETSESGAKALEQMRVNMPDILLTDIQMNNMNGLQLIRKMNEINPELRIIVLTGYDDFAFVQECCRMEVHDYLLKPVDIEQLTEAIKCQIQKLEERRQEIEEQKSIERVLGLKEQMKMEKYLHRLLKRESVNNEIHDVFVRNHWREGESLCVAIIPPTEIVEAEWGSRFELLDVSVNTVCLEMVEYQGHGISLRDENNILLLILFGGEKHPVAMELLRKLQKILQLEYGVAQEIYLGKEVSKISEIPDSYESAKRLWTAQKNRSNVIHMAGISAITEEDEIQADVSEIQANLMHLDHALEMYQEYWDKLLKMSETTENKSRKWLHDMTDIYMTWMKENGHEQVQILNDLILATHGAEFKELREIGQRFLTSLIGTKSLDSNDVIGNVKHYIDRHLDEELSVTKLAEQFYLSVAYFSKLFKKTEGVGCNYYIMQKRMEKAKVLLRQKNAKVMEVATQVGYRDVYYFSMTFKKYTGLAPADYREQ